MGLHTSEAVLSKEITTSPRTVSKGRETTHVSKWQFSSTVGRTKFSTLLLPATTVLATSAVPNVSEHSTLGTSTIFSSPKSSLPSFEVTVSPAAITGPLPDKQTSSTTITATPSASIITGTESKPISTLSIIRIPSIITDSESPVTTRAVSKTKVIGASSFPTEETQTKPKRITEGAAYSITTSVTEVTSKFLTKPTTVTPFEISYLPKVNRTTIADKTKPGISRLPIMAANVTIISFSPLFTTLSALKPVVKPVPFETTKTTAVLTKEEIKTTVIPVPTQLPITVQTALLTSTVKKEMVQTTTSSSTHPSSSPYSATTSKLDILSAKFPGVLQTGKIMEYSPRVQLNRTEGVTISQTQYPAATHTIRATPPSTKVVSRTTDFAEIPKLISVSRETSTEYKEPLFLKTTKMTAVPQPVSVTKSDFTKEFTDTAVTVPLVTKKIEPVRTTGYSFSLPAVTTGLGKTQSEGITSVPKIEHTPLIPPSLRPLLPEALVTTVAIQQPITKTTSFFSVFPLTTELRSTVTSRSTSELTEKAALSDTGVTLFPYSEFSSQFATVKEAASTKGISTFSTSAAFPLTPLSTTLYVAKTAVSPYRPEIPGTARQPIETKISPTAPDTTHSVPFSPMERVSSHVKEEFSVPFLMTKTTGRYGFSPASKAYLTTKGTTTAYHFPPEVARTSSHPTSAVSTTESAVKVATSFPFQSTSEPVVAPSTVSVVSVSSTKVPSTSEKEIPQTVKADTGLKTTLLTSTRKAADLTSSERPLFTTSKVIATLLPLTTIKEGAVDLTPTEKSETGLPTTKQALTLTESSPLSESTPSSFFTLEVPETLTVSQMESQEGAFLTPVVSTAITSLGKSATEKISPLSKHVPLSTVSYSSSFPAFSVTPGTPHFTTESAPLGISGLTTQSITKSLAEKTAGIREPITTSLFPVSSVALEAKTVTELPELHFPPKQLPPSFSPLGSTILTTTFETPSALEVLTSSTSLLPVLVFPNATVATSIPTYLSAKPISESTTKHSVELATVEAVSAVTASVFMPSRETVTLPTCIVSNTVVLTRSNECFLFAR